MSKDSKRKRIRRKAKGKKSKKNKIKKDEFVLNEKEAEKYFQIFIKEYDGTRVDKYSLLNDIAFRYLISIKINSLINPEAEKKVVRFFANILHEQAV